MAAKMKVYAWGDYVHVADRGDGRRRRDGTFVVAATSARKAVEAARAAGIWYATTGRLSNYGGVSTHPEEVRVATLRPGVLLWQELARRDEWYVVEGGQAVRAPGLAAPTG